MKIFKISLLLGLGFLANANDKLPDCLASLGNLDSAISDFKQEIKDHIAKQEFTEELQKKYISELETYLKCINNEIVDPNIRKELSAKIDELTNLVLVRYKNGLKSKYPKLV